MIKIYGASDDLVEIEGHKNGDEINIIDGSVVVTIGDRTGGVIVRMEYGPKWDPAGVWAASIAPIDEDIPIPWPVSVVLGGRGYSAEVHIGAPDDVPLSWKKWRKK